MKNLYLLALLGGLCLFYINPIFSQTTIYGGITSARVYAQGTTERSFDYPGGFESTGGNTNYGIPLWAIGAQARVETPFSNRLKFGLTGHFFQNISRLDEGIFPPHLNVTNMGEEISSSQKYYSLGGDATLIYNFLPNSVFKIGLGTGVSLLYRSYHYRSAFLFDIDNEGLARLVEEDHSTDKLSTLGIPLTARIGVQASPKISLGLNAAFRQYFNGEQQFGLGLEVGYRL